MLRMQQQANVTVSVGSTTANLITALTQANPSTCVDHTILNLPTNVTYTLSGFDNTFTPEGLGATGLPIIRCEVTINGNGSTIVRSTAAGTPAFRLFGIAATGWLHLNNITLRNGYATTTGGGAILNVFGGQLDISNSVVENNFTAQTSNAQTLGAGIYTYQGRLNIQNSRISGNQNTSVYGDGGGVGTINGNITISGSQINMNMTTTQGGGLAILFPASSSISNNCLSGNIL